MKIRPEPSPTHGPEGDKIRDSSLPKPGFNDLEKTTDIRVPESERKEMGKILGRKNPALKEFQQGFASAILKDLEKEFKNRLKGG